MKHGRIPKTWYVDWPGENPTIYFANIGKRISVHYDFKLSYITIRMNILGRYSFILTYGGNEVGFSSTMAYRRNKFIGDSETYSLI